jgi:hypothetical protein
LLCLYAVYGDITEAKATFLRGARAYSDFRFYALDFVFNLSVNPADRQGWHEIFGNFFDYLRILQVNYHLLLSERGLAHSPHVFSLSTPEVTWESVREGHRALCAADGTKPDDGDIEELLASADSGWEFGDSLEDYTLGLRVAREAFTQLGNFEMQCLEHDVKLFHNPNQTIAEFSMFLTHIARGFRLRLSGETQSGIKEVNASLGHLKRITLDMRKSIIATALKQKPDAFGDALLRSLLQARQDEQRMPVEDSRKFHIYESELQQVLTLEIFS